MLNWCGVWLTGEPTLRCWSKTQINSSMDSSCWLESGAPNNVYILFCFLWHSGFPDGIRVKGKRFSALLLPFFFAQSQHFFYFYIGFGLSSVTNGHCYFKWLVLLPLSVLCVCNLSLTYRDRTKHSPKKYKINKLKVASALQG